MANNIKLEFTQSQFRTLLDIIYSGVSVLTSTNEKNEEKYNEIESMIFSYTKDIGKAEYSDFEETYGGYLPSSKFENSGVLERMTQYEDFVFWNELSHRLALRDVANTIRVDNSDILLEALLDRTDEYDEYFEDHGVSDIFIDGMPPINVNTRTIRSMDLGDVELPEQDDE